MTTDAPTTKIAIVSGKEFQVALEIDNETIRQHLAKDFPDVASATIKTGSRKIGDQTYETVEFVKKAGTKGMDGAELGDVLRRVPRKDIDTRPATPDMDLVRRLCHGGMTIAEVHATRDDLFAALYNAIETPSSGSKEGERLCSKLESIPAVAVERVRCAW